MSRDPSDFDQQPPSFDQQPPGFDQPRAGFKQNHPGFDQPGPPWQSSGPRVTWERPQTVAYALPPQARKLEPERTQAMVVMILTMACTVLAIYDLFLLATGVG